jgi:serine-type D-Ala-D-Ala carboxypeptidase (penicillin-binding protein 5/6)
VLAVLAALVVFVAAGGAVTAVRLRAAPSGATLRSELPASLPVPGRSPAIPWPTGVQAAYAVPSLGVSDQSGSEVPAPIASIAKLMTAYVVLHDHPLAAGESGPSITITPNDVGLYENDVASGETNLEVQSGEVLTELQLLEGMLVHSANNFADLLAIFDAGSLADFELKMNAAAKSLGMTNTDYTDPSGFTATTVSTAADQLKVAAQDMANPVFASIVALHSVTLPVAGTVGSYTPLVGLDDVVGVKSGFTDAAGGCDILALEHTVGARRVVVLAAILGYQGAVDVLDPAGLEALSVARSASAGVRADRVLSAGQDVGSASVGAAAAPVVARSGVTIVGWAGQRVSLSIAWGKRPRPGARRGTAVGTIAVGLDGHESHVAAETGRGLPTPSFWQRVF